MLGAQKKTPTAGEAGKSLKISVSVCYTVHSYFPWSYSPASKERLYQMGQAHDFTALRKEKI